MPFPKNVCFAAVPVRSINWSGTTMSRGVSSSRRLPTAVTEMTQRTPSERSAQIFARWLISCGSTRWPTPWRGRKQTRRPWRVPEMTLSEGSPNGVAIDSSEIPSNPSIS